MHALLVFASYHLDCIFELTFKTRHFRFQCNNLGGLPLFARHLALSGARRVRRHVHLANGQNPKPIELCHQRENRARYPVALFAIFDIALQTYLSFCKMPPNGCITRVAENQTQQRRHSPSQNQARRTWQKPRRVHTLLGGFPIASGTQASKPAFLPRHHQKQVSNNNRYHKLHNHL